MSSWCPVKAYYYYDYLSCLFVGKRYVRLMARATWPSVCRLSVTLVVQRVGLFSSIIAPSNSLETRALSLEIMTKTEGVLGNGAR